MELEGFWVFVSIIIVSTAYIFLMTRPSGDDVNGDDDQREISD